MRTMNRPIRGHSGARRVQALALLLGVALSAGLLAPTSAQRRHSGHGHRERQRPRQAQHRGQDRRRPLPRPDRHRDQQVGALDQDQLRGRQGVRGQPLPQRWQRSPDGEQGRCRHRQDHHGRPQPAQGPRALVRGDQGPPRGHAGHHDRQDRPRLRRVDQRQRRPAGPARSTWRSPRAGCRRSSAPGSRPPTSTSEPPAARIPRPSPR